MQAKQKGVGHLIEQANPNRAGNNVSKKVTNLGDGKAQLSRRERLFYVTCATTLIYSFYYILFCVPVLFYTVT